MKWFNECYGVYLFGIYLLLNVLDWLTGWYKARVKKEASSKAGWIWILDIFRLLAGLHWRIF